jgi:hypothetical protein
MIEYYMMALDESTVFSLESFEAATVYVKLQEGRQIESEAKIAKNKVVLLSMAQMRGSVFRACKVFAYWRESFCL